MGRVEHGLLFLVTAGLLAHTFLVGCDLGSGAEPAASIAGLLAGDAEADAEDCGCEGDEVAEASSAATEAAAEDECPHEAMIEAHREAGVETSCPYLHSLETEPARDEAPEPNEVNPRHTADRDGGSASVWL